MLHFMYVGHFAHQGDFIRFDKQPDGSLQPAVERPLSLDVVHKALKQRGLSPSSIPDEWGVWLDNGYIVCDAVTRCRGAIEFIRDLAQETGCDLADYSSQSLLSPAEFARDRPVQPEQGYMPAPGLTMKAEAASEFAEPKAAADRPRD